MVNAQKHRELLKDWQTRAHKKVIKETLQSNNAQKKETWSNKVLYNNGGVAGRRSIVETEQKRQNAKHEFIQVMLDKKDGA